MNRLPFDTPTSGVMGEGFQSIIVTLTTVVLRIPLFERTLCLDSLPSRIMRFIVFYSLGQDRGTASKAAGRKP